MPVVGNIEGEKLVSRSLMSRETGKMIYDLEHLRNCITDILTTQIGSRVMRRSYGSNLFLLVDRPVNAALVFEMRRTIFEALEKWEPRIYVESIVLNLDELNKGKVTIKLDGWYKLEGRPLRMDGITLDFFRHNPYNFNDPAFRITGTPIGDIFGEAEKPMILAFVGDSGIRNAVQEKTAALVKSWNPDLFLLAGDCNYPSGSELTMEPNTRLFQSLIAEHRLLAVPGNHDHDTDNGAAYYKKFYYLSGNKRYWSEFYPSVSLLIVGVNTGYKTNGVNIEPDGITQDSVQGKWVRDVIETTGAKHVFVMMHHPFASAVTGGGGDAKTDLAWLRTLPVSAILCGHTHIGEHMRFKYSAQADILNVSASAQSQRAMSTSGTLYGDTGDLARIWQYAPNGQVGPPIVARIYVTSKFVQYQIYNVLTGDIIYSFVRGAIGTNDFIPAGAMFWNDGTPAMWNDGHYVQSA